MIGPTRLPTAPPALSSRSTGFASGLSILRTPLGAGAASVGAGSADAVFVPDPGVMRFRLNDATNYYREINAIPGLDPVGRAPLTAPTSPTR